MIEKDQRRQFSEWIKARAYELGFDACGISKAEKLENEEERLLEWLMKGYHGEMSYMARNVEKRLDPRLMVDGTRSVISVLLNYFPGQHLPDHNNYKIARYAYGRDYHEELRERLNRLIGDIGSRIEEFEIRNAQSEMQNEIFSARAFTDSAPVLDKAWAERAGLGWIGKNTCLINPQLGSYFFIGEILTNLELAYDTGRVNDFCGGCTRCIDACPTGAIIAPRVLDARKCISYLTIEYKGDLPETERNKFDGWIFGCDICQEVCPWNRFARPGNVENFSPSPELTEMNKDKWQELTEGQFQKMFKGSAVKRAKFTGLKRNIEFLSGGK